MLDIMSQLPHLARMNDKPKRKLPNATKSTSKKLALILRHAPEKAGLTLAPGGWVSVEDLLTGFEKMGRPITRDWLEKTVNDNDKKRYQISADGLNIRAVQGHSVEIEMEYQPVTPPETLYHGTATRTLDMILAGGLKPMNRQYVHLSLEKNTAIQVGKRHGKPVVLTLDTAQHLSNGGIFYRAENGVWLTGPVAPDCLSVQ